ncbi:RING finger protein 150-like [Branchiostoma lanceolatum]|uniref:RING finger protein 150-like n=1 Tax=Branchiostoma lanceolatum TaxID=7740 RepID=UPI003452602B
MVVGEERTFVYGLCLLLCVMLWFGSAQCMVGEDAATEYTKAFVNVTYIDPSTNKLHSEKEEVGVYGKNSPTIEARGIVVNVGNACRPLSHITPPKKQWIALVVRGICDFRIKINHAKSLNASAVVVYNHETSPPETMAHEGTGNIVAIMISRAKGLEIVTLLDNGTQVMMHITMGTHTRYKVIDKTSVLFVSISFIVLMIISLAWLVFYYIQRFRYAHARDRSQRRFATVAKKAITKIPVKTIRKGDKEVEWEHDSCAVCIDNYKPSDVVRVLPCKHIFHKLCVDPWLIEHRTCPMCKLNILKALGYLVPSSTESLNIDVEATTTNGSFLGNDTEDESVDQDSAWNNIVTVALPPPDPVATQESQGGDQSMETDDDQPSPAVVMSETGTEMTERLPTGDVDQESGSEGIQLSPTDQPAADSNANPAVTV